MEYAIGAGLALAVGIFAATVGFDRDRAFYPTVVLVVASYYELFAAMAGSTSALKLESLGVAAFVVAAVVAFRKSLWVAVAALAAHGVFDLSHAAIVANPGVPSWWPMFCSAYDLTAAGFLAVKLLLDRRPALPPQT